MDRTPSSPEPSNREEPHRPSSVRTAIRSVDRTLRRGRLRESRKRVLIPLLITSALALTAAAVGLMAHPEAAAALSALTTVYIAAVNTYRKREERPTPPTRAPEHRLLNEQQTRPVEDAPRRPEPDPTPTTDPITRYTTDADRTSVPDETRFRDDQHRPPPEPRNRPDPYTGKE